MLSSPDGIFTTGFLEYADSYLGLQEPLPRIYVPFRPDGTHTWHLALLDTGGHFCILSPEVADTIADQWTSGFEETSMITARGRFRGQLYRHRIELIAEEGEDCGVEATVFISPEWQGPSVLGYTGMLDRMRWAIDPPKNRLHIGPLA